MTKRTVEQTRQIDVRALQSAGFFKTPKAGYWTWRISGQLDSAAQMKWDGHQLKVGDQVIGYVWVDCPFGGARPWFVCGCNRRVGKLYSPRGLAWTCRHCYGLTYATRQAVPRHRRIMRAQNIRMNLGGSPSLLEDFPDRPKGMHRARYNRLRKEHDRAVKESFGMMAAWVDRLCSRNSGD